MKLIATLSLALLIFIPGTTKCQNYDEAIRKMFSVKDDVDFLLKSESGGESSYLKYYIANDTMYEHPTRKIALQDIDFTKKDMFNNVFNFINGKYPWVLTIHPKAGTKTFYYGTAVNGVIDMYLPDKAFAEQTFTYLQTAAQTITSNAGQPKKVADTNKEPLCETVVDFLNDMKETNLANYLGKQKATSVFGTSYYSKTPFPQAKETIIIKSAIGSGYHSVTATYMEETSRDSTITPAMIAKYKELVNKIKACLLPNKFEMKEANPAVWSLYEMSTEFSKLAPKSNSVFANIQTRPGYIVRVVILQTGNVKDKFVNSVEIYLERQ